MACCTASTWRSVIFKAWYTLFYGCQVCLAPYLVLHYQRCGLSPTHVGFLLALSPWVSAPSGVLWSWLADNLGSHKLMLLVTLPLSMALKAAVVEGSQFLYFVVIVAATELVGNAVMALVDTAALSSCKQEGDYGKLRQWGAIGWGAFSGVAGYMVQLFGVKGALLPYFALGVPCVLLTLWLPMVQHEDVAKGELQAPPPLAPDKYPPWLDPPEDPPPDTASANKPSGLRHSMSAASSAIVAVRRDTEDSPTLSAATPEDALIFSHGLGNGTIANGTMPSQPAANGTALSHSNGTVLSRPTGNWMVPTQSAGNGTVLSHLVPNAAMGSMLIQPATNGTMLIQPAANGAMLSQTAANKVSSSLVLEDGLLANAALMNTSRLHRQHSVTGSPDQHVFDLPNHDVQQIGQGKVVGQPAGALLQAGSAEVTHETSRVAHSNGVDSEGDEDAWSLDRSARAEDIPALRSGKRRANLFSLLCDPHVLCFLFLVGLIGFGLGLVGAFAFLVLDQLHGSEMLMGLTLTANCIAEVPVFQFQTYLLQIVSPSFLQHVVVLMVVVCGLGWAFLPLAPSPWLCLLWEFMRGGAFALEWGLGTLQGRRLAPKGMETTMQSLVQGMFYGVGNGLGSFVGGVLSKQYGFQNMYLIAAVIMLLGWALYMVMQLLLASFCPAPVEQSAVAKPVMREAEAEEVADLTVPLLVSAV